MAALTLIWRNPPVMTETRQPATRKRRREEAGHAYEEAAAQLRANPGRWAVIDQFPAVRAVTARTTSAGIKTGRYTALRPAGDFETTTATERDEQGYAVVNLYARYTGPPDGGR